MKTLLIAALMIPAASADELRITVYDTAKLPHELTLSTIHYLRQIFHNSGIEIHWLAGAPDADEASLFLYPGEPRKGREEETVCRARRDIALKISPAAPRGLGSAALGLAQPLAPAGLNVNVFDDRIRQAVSARNQQHAIVLAHAFAHEIGHVLLRSNVHSAHGLMAEIWGAYEYGLMAHVLMFFTAEQSRRMRATLAGVNCPVESRSSESECGVRLATRESQDSPIGQIRNPGTQPQSGGCTTRTYLAARAERNVLRRNVVAGARPCRLPLTGNPAVQVGRARQPARMVTAASRRGRMPQDNGVVDPRTGRVGRRAIR